MYAVNSLLGVLKVTQKVSRYIDIVDRWVFEVFYTPR